MNAWSWVVVIWAGVVLAVPSLWILAVYLWPVCEGRHRNDRARGST